MAAKKQLVSSISILNLWLLLLTFILIILSYNQKVILIITAAPNQFEVREEFIPKPFDLIDQNTFYIPFQKYTSHHQSYFLNFCPKSFLLASLSAHKMNP